MLLPNILFLLILLVLVYYCFSDFRFFLHSVYPFAIFFGNYITIGSTSIHVAELFIPIFLLKNPFSKRLYNVLDIGFILFFIIGFAILSFNSDRDFLYFKTLIRFSEILIVYFIYSKYHFLIKLIDIRKYFSRFLIILLLISSVNLIYISFYDSYSWMQLLIELGYIPKNVERLGYLDSWSSNNSVQGNFLIEHQYGIMIVSCLYLSLTRHKYLAVIITSFFLFLATSSYSIQFSLIVSLCFYFINQKSIRRFLYISLFLFFLFIFHTFWEEIKLIYYQIYFLFKSDQIPEINSGFIRLGYIFKGFSDPSFNWISGIGLHIFKNDINPHEIITYLYFLYGLPAVFFFLWIFYSRFVLKVNNPFASNLLKSYFLFAFVASFGINYFTSIVTFFPFILFLNYHKFIPDESSNSW